MFINEAENPQLTTLNELFMKNHDSLPIDVENSIYYARLRQLLHPEIFNFCKEQEELKADLNFLRLCIGEPITESEIRDYLNGLKEKYNKNDKVGIEYHIEVTRIDYGVPVFCVIQRGNAIHMKKFVFRFRKANQEAGVGDLSNAGIISDSLKNDAAQERKEKANKIIGGMQQ